MVNKFGHLLSNLRRNCGVEFGVSNFTYQIISKVSGISRSNLSSDANSGVDDQLCSVF